MAGNLDLDTLRHDVASGAIDTVFGLHGRHAGPADRQAGHRALLPRAGGRRGALPATTCSRPTWRWSRCRATRRPRGTRATAISRSGRIFRRCAGSPGSTARRWCSATCFDHHGHDLPHSPRAHPQAPARPRRRHGLCGLHGLRARVLRLRRAVRSGPSETLSRPQGCRLVHRGLPHLSDHQGGGPVRAIRNFMDAAGIPVEYSKGEWGPGQAELNLRYAEALEMADRHAIYKNGVKEIAWLQGKAVTFMAKWDFALAGNSCHVHTSLRDAERRSEPSPTPRASRRVCFRTSLQASSRSRATWPSSSRRTSTRTSASRRAPSRRPRRSGAATTAPRASGWSAPARPAGRVPIPGADANVYLAFAALVAAGLFGIEQELEPGPAFTGNAYVGKDIPEVPRLFARRWTAWTSRRRCARLRRPGGRPLPALRPLGAVRVRPPDHGPRADPRLRARLATRSPGFTGSIAGPLPRSLPGPFLGHCRAPYFGHCRASPGNPVPS